MTDKEIRTELDNVYREMSNWSRVNRFLKRPLPEDLADSGFS
ncbi:MAG: hypothetical protein QME57_05125 [Patescibacteria group bacterium]|nr:hypothetical protein [Patescibacteria group bacterium]